MNSMGAAGARGVNTALILPVERSGRSCLLKSLRPTPTIDTPATKFPETVLNDTASPQITMYTSAVCAYCVAAKNFLRSKGLEWTEVRIDTDPEERRRMMSLAGRTSVPQIFVGDVHVGGYDDMMAMHRAGRFEPLVQGKGE